MSDDVATATVELEVEYERTDAAIEEGIPPEDEISIILIAFLTLDADAPFIRDVRGVDDE